MRKVPLATAFSSPIRCPRCGSTTIIYDEESSSLVCYNCGYVFEQNVASYGSPLVKLDGTLRHAPIADPEEIYRAKDLVIRKNGRKDIVDKVDVLANNVLAEISLRSEIMISDQYYRIIRELAFKISDVVMSELNNYSKMLRAKLTSCLAEAIMNAMRIPYSEVKCDLTGTSKNAKEAVLKATRVARKMATPIQLNVFRNVLIEKGMVRHPGELIMFPNKEAYDAFSRTLSFFEINHLTCMLNKFRAVRSFAVPGGLRSLKCGGYLDRMTAYEYVMSVAKHFRSEFSLIAMSSAFDAMHNTSRIIVPNEIYGLIMPFLMIKDTPKYWVASSFSQMTRQLNYFSTINDLGYLVSAFDITVSGKKIDDIFTEAFRKRDFEIEEVPAMPAVFIASPNVHKLIHKSIMYVKILIGGSLLLYKFLKSNYPEILDGMEGLREFVSQLKDSEAKILVPPRFKEYASVVRAVADRIPRNTVFRYNTVRVVRSSRGALQLA